VQLGSIDPSEAGPEGYDSDLVAGEVIGGASGIPCADEERDAGCW